MSAETQNIDPSHVLYSWFVPELSSEPNFTLKIKLSEAEREKLSRAAKAEGLTMTNLVQKWVNCLPESDR